MEAAEFAPFSEGLDYPMFVLTVGPVVEPRPSGCLVGFATQCSISPVRFLVCVSKANHTFRALDGAKFVGVHLLGDTHRDLARLFGTETGDKIDKFERCAWTVGPKGVPILDQCVSWFVGRVDRWTDLGDHVGVLVTPMEVAGGSAPALMSASVRDLEAGHDA